MPKVVEFEIQRLGLWGQKDESLINFEWPTKDMIEDLPADVTLKSLKFKEIHKGCAISSVKCTLTNGQESPLFEMKGQHHARF